ncbi:PREDICTED: lipase 3-like [Nicrophorus vespilloides]|uniref:Lipase n=1 Tax=Nicrophorus vespilloides TaxID=110193 RepID=A0ABM1NDC1_NICVS|nr:PREDICTED: lipase 3-like [Nicrophorus vespilloides]
MVCFNKFLYFLFINFNSPFRTCIFDIEIKNIVESHGYPFEEYKDIQTPDGYLLTLHRIPYGKNVSDKTVVRPPVFLMHGILCSSINFVFAGPNISISYQLADRGYDVWLGNSRSTSYSKKHILYDVKSFEFWNFSMDELGVNDLGTSIEFVLKQTNCKKLTYIGHSHGNTILAILINEQPKFNDQIKLYIALAPSLSYSTYYHPWLTRLSYLIPVFKQLGLYEFPPMLNYVNNIVALICDNNNNITNTLCILLMEIAVGPEKYINKTASRPFFERLLEGIGYKNFEHILQVYYSGGKLRKFDFGVYENFRIYGNAIPPDYEINKIHIPTAIYYTSHDWFNSREDVEIALKEVPNVVDDYLVTNDVFNHLDFLWARNIKDLLCSRVISLIDSYNKIV